MRGVGSRFLLQMALERQLAAQELGRRIAAHRAQRGWTQEDAAQRVGVTYRAYQRWENGDSMPYARNLHRLADAFGVSPDTFLAITTEQPRNGARGDEVVSQGELLDRLDQIERKLNLVLLTLGVAPLSVEEAARSATEAIRSAEQEPPAEGEARSA